MWSIIWLCGFILSLLGSYHVNKKLERDDEKAIEEGRSEDISDLGDKMELYTMFILSLALFILFICSLC